MLHKLTGVTIVVTLILMLLLKFAVLAGTIVTLGAVALLLASCVLTAVSFVKSKRVKPAAPVQPTPPGEPNGVVESPMQVACRYMRTGDALKGEGKFDEAIATYREGAETASNEPALGPEHAIVFLLNSTARNLEEAHRKGAAAVRK